MRFLQTLTLIAVGGFLFAACSTRETVIAPLNGRDLGKEADSPAFSHPGKPLAPKATLYNGITTAIIRQVETRGAAAKAGVRVGDELIRINGKKYFSAAAFEHAIKMAPRNSTVTFKRGDAFRIVGIILSDDNPRLGAKFEPDAIPLRRQSSPFIAYMHLNDITVYAESSLNELKKELHVNFIVKSDKFLPTANMNFVVSEKGRQTPLGKGYENLDALGSSPHLISKVFKKEGELKGPLEVMLNVDKRHFQFEFQ